jgi:hypothetical protein
MNVEPPAWIPRTMSRPRFAGYLRAAAGNAEAALRLYWWNIEISSAFFGPLHCLVLSLRNALHLQLCALFGRADWWAAVRLTDEGARTIAAVRAKLVRRSATPVGVDDIVAGLSFGFWVSLLSRGRAYDRAFWVPALHKAFPGFSGRREQLHDNLVAMLLLRNRIMHHEPIHHRDLGADHAKIYRLLGYLSPALAKEAQPLDRVPDALARRSSVCGGQLRPSF